MNIITFLGRDYRVVRHGDSRVVIVRRSARQWRLASARITALILAGLCCPALKVLP
jgi:hypothetical protein